MTKWRKIAISVVSVGGVFLAAGIAILALILNMQPEIRDAEYLVSLGEWTRTDAPEVVWNFTEIGKGVLSSNNHLNDYDFEWAIREDKLEVETDWLYELNDTFNYELNRDENTLTLIRGSEKVVFNYKPES